jgi:hypothetical protein
MNKIYWIIILLLPELASYPNHHIQGPTGHSCHSFPLSHHRTPENLDVLLTARSYLRDGCYLADNSLVPPQIQNDQSAEMHVERFRSTLTVSVLRLSPCVRHFPVRDLELGYAVSSRYGLGFPKSLWIVFWALEVAMARIYLLLRGPVVCLNSGP